MIGLTNSKSIVEFANGVIPRYIPPADTQIQGGLDPKIKAINLAQQFATGLIKPLPQTTIKTETMQTIKPLASTQKAINEDKAKAIDNQPFYKKHPKKIGGAIVGLVLLTLIVKKVFGKKKKTFTKFKKR